MIGIIEILKGRTKEMTKHERPEAMKPVHYSDDETLIAYFEECARLQPAESVPWIITPALAEHMLKRNLNNRRPTTRVERYAKAMKEGKWELSGATIVFSSDGRLLDGQHRLLACVASGVPFRTYVIFGLGRNVFPLIDDIKPRYGKDILHVAGVKNDYVSAAAIRWIQLLRTGRAKSRGTFPPYEMLEIYKSLNHALFDDAVKYGMRLYENQKLDRHPKGMIAAIYYVFHEANPTLARLFFDAWLSGRWTGRFVVLEKMTRAMRDEQAATRGRVHETVRMAIYITAWNLVAQNRAGTITAFNWTMSEQFPEIAS